MSANESKSMPNPETLGNRSFRIAPAKAAALLPVGEGVGCGLHFLRQPAGPSSPSTPVAPITDDILSTFTPKQLAALEQLITCPVIEEAARRAGCTSRSIRYWMAQPAFRQAYLQAKRTVMDAVIHDTIAEAQYVNNQSMAVLRHNLHCGNPFAEIRAASAALSVAYKEVGSFSQDERLAELEHCTNK